MENPAELDHQSILLKARTIKHGKWIERILRQTRKSMTGIGVKDYKDLSDKQKNLPNLTGPTVHGAWEKDVFRLAGEIMDGKQLAHLVHVLSNVEENIPLPPEFKTLSDAEFNLATASSEQLKLRAEFETEWQAFKDSGFSEKAIEGTFKQKLEAVPMTPGSEDEEVRRIPKGSEVEVELLPPPLEG